MEALAMRQAVRRRWYDKGFQHALMYRGRDPGKREDSAEIEYQQGWKDGRQALDRIADRVIEKQAGDKATRLAKSLGALWR